MQRIEVENEYALYLNHRDLINSSYNQNLANNNRSKYALKASLFDYRPKSTNTINIENTIKECKQTKNTRKRKANTATTYDPTPDNSMLAKNINKFLQHLQIQEQFPIKTHFSALSRYWEESYELPKLHGANTTDTHQIFDYAQHKYIIPPRCHFFNANVLELSQLLPQLPVENFDLIVLDPPWRNKYIRRLKHARQQLAYTMLDNAQLQQLPIARLTHRDSLVAIWCTNATQHQTALIQEFLPAWHLRLLHSLKWVKINTAGQLVTPLGVAGQKQPYEMLYIACHCDADAKFATRVSEVQALYSVPSIVHSHKPPLLPWLSSFLPEQPKCLEIFARYLQPQFTSIGLEVLKLMDARLYDTVES